MMKRRYVFPHIIEMNLQAGERLGVNVYLIEDAGEFILIDIGYEDTVDDIIDLIRKMDFSLSACKMLVATHADVDHTQGLKRAQEILKAPIAAHPAAVSALETGDPETTFSRIKAQNIDIPMPPVKVDSLLEDGQILKVGKQELTVWSTPGHTAGQLAFKFGPVLFVGDNIYKDGSVGVIDAHHGSHLPDFVASLERILNDDSKLLLPSHGPIFPRDNALIQRTIDRLKMYQYLADFGTCAVGWPLLDEWEESINRGLLPSVTEGDFPQGTVIAEDGEGNRSRLPGALS